MDNSGHCNAESDFEVQVTTKLHSKPIRGMGPSKRVPLLLPWRMHICISPGPGPDFLLCVRSCLAIMWCCCGRERPPQEEPLPIRDRRAEEPWPPPGLEVVWECFLAWSSMTMNLRYIRQRLVRPFVHWDEPVATVAVEF